MGVSIDWEKADARQSSTSSPVVERNLDWEARKQLACHFTVPYPSTLPPLHQLSKPIPYHTNNLQCHHPRIIHCTTHHSSDYLVYQSGPLQSATDLCCSPLPVPEHHSGQPCFLLPPFPPFTTYRTHTLSLHSSTLNDYLVVVPSRSLHLLQRISREVEIIFGVVQCGCDCDCESPTPTYVIYRSMH